MSARVVVVGAGLAGLAAAHDLSMLGAQVLVLDAGDRPGGKVRSVEVAGVQVDVGAESALAVRPELVDLVRDMGLGDRLIAPTTTSASVWSRGELHPLPAGTLMGIPGDPRSAAGLLTASEVERARAEEPWLGEVSTDVSVGEYVAARLGDAVVDRLVEPLLGGVYAGQARRISLRAATPSLWAAVQAGESLLETVAGVAGGRGTRVGSVFAGVVDGFGSLPDALASVVVARHGEVRSGAVVRGLERSSDGWALRVGPTTDAETVTADAVVIAVPPAPGARLLGPHAPRAADLLARIETASMAVVTLAFAKDALGALPGSGFLVPPVEGWTTKAATFSSAKWGWLDAAGGDTAYVRASVGRAGEARALQQSDEDLVAAVLADLSRALHRRLPGPLDVHVQRWGGALPQYAVGHLDAVAAIRADLAGVRGLVAAGAAYDGVGLPAVVGTGRAAARALAAELGLKDSGHD